MARCFYCDHNHDYKPCNLKIYHYQSMLALGKDRSMQGCIKLTRELVQRRNCEIRKHNYPCGD